jgi:magnesium-transporting ATPase (P-type)
MVTGDNELTAINVGKNCSIIGNQHIYIAKLIGGQYETLESIEYVALRDLDFQEDEFFDNCKTSCYPKSLCIRSKRPKHPMRISFP